MRILTRSDFDGLGCAVLLKEVGMMDDIKFVHPKDIQDGLVQVTSDDILANIPYVPGCGMWFDHHSSEEERKLHGEFEGSCDPNAPSAARVIYDYYGGKEKFSDPHFDELIAAVDKADSADFTADEILNPSGWVLLSFVMDPRTGLGRYHDYRISNYALMLDMIDYCRSKSIDEILEVPDVQERTMRYFEQDALFRGMIDQKAVVRGNVIVLDLRDQEEIYTGNRFLVYSMFPDQNISIQVIWGFQRQNIVMTCGHSIINRTSKTNVGSLCLKYGGGGHEKVGTCQVPIEKADAILEEIIAQMNQDG
ncbi:exopolyphosphatase [Desulfatibacillum aliphaticivorans]|uniref:exopolyphosphatase n=1 Tax=Desulfatibacillum aliphaticivorans TaxID=218208 RepID=UPI000403AC94|nr:exopolyphosphatase [Desulfatibacillum aliphaticivorans]